jgi:hypothetical protein
MRLLAGAAAGCAGAAALAGDPPATAGTLTGFPQPGHFTAFPAIVSGRFKALPHWQLIRIGMGTINRKGVIGFFRDKTLRRVLPV